MKIKSGVRVLGIRPEIVLALVVLEPLFAEEAVELVVTSLIDGKHSRGSLHYAGAAVDLRTRHMTREASVRVRDKAAAALGADYDVVLERDHIHLEFQPKAPY